MAFLSHSLFTYHTHDVPVLSTEAASKSKFCTTAHVEYTQSRSAVSTTATTIKVRNGRSRRSDAFRQPAEQCVGIIISTDTSNSPYASICTRTRTTTTET